MFDGAAADPELRCDFVVGILRNAAQDEHGSTKYVQTSMDLRGVVDQPKKLLDRERRVLRRRFTYLIFGSKFCNLNVLPLERASNGGSGAPVYEPFVKV